MKLTNTSKIGEGKVFALIAGHSGIGKTYLARTLPEDETLIISAESGLLSLKGTSIDVFNVNTMSDMEEVLEAVENTKIKHKYIYVDSLTELLDKFVAELKQNKRYQDKKYTFELWDVYMQQAVRIIKTLRDSPYYVFFTCLSTKEKDGLVMVDQFDFSGSKLKSKIKSYFDLVLHYKTIDFEGVNTRVLITDEAESSLAKDRSGILETYEQPNLGKLINKIME